MKESILRLVELCDRCGVAYIPKNKEACDCEEPKVQEWDGIGWRPELEMKDDE